MATSTPGIKDPTMERLTREQTSRSAAELEAEWNEWTPATFTAAPPPLDGFEQRWVRCRLGGSDDLQNFLKRTQQGWRPRPVDTLPKAYIGLKQKMDERFGDYGSIIGNQDCVLMHRPVRIGQQVRSSIQEQTARLSASVRDFVSGNMPRQHGTRGGSVDELSLKVTTGNGRTPRIADD